MALSAWSNKWGMSLNYDKCKILSFCKHASNCITYDYTLTDKSGASINIERVNTVTDLGVSVDNELSFSQHVYDNINMAYKMVGIIKRVFLCLTKDSFLILFKSLVRPHLEYAHSVWNPYKRGLITDIEKVQK